LLRSSPWRLGAAEVQRKPGREGVGCLLPIRGLSEAARGLKWTPLHHDRICQAKSSDDGSRLPLTVLARRRSRSCYDGSDATDESSPPSQRGVRVRGDAPRWSHDSSLRSFSPLPSQ